MADAVIDVTVTAGGVIDVNVTNLDTTITGTVVSGAPGATGAIGPTGPNSFINVKDYGAIGDGSTDDTTTLQAALTAGITLGKAVLFPAGTYITDTLSVKYGQTLVGISGATLKLKNGLGNWHPVLSTESYKWSATSPTEDSPILSISGLTIDGNQANQGAYTGYENQQSSGIFLWGTDDNTFGTPRLRTVIDNCVIKNTCGDGVNVWKSIDVVITNSYFWNCFRGGVTMTSGNSVVKIDSITCGGDLWSSYLDFELEGDQAGIVDIANSYFEPLRGNAAAGDGMKFIMQPNSRVTVTNCYLGAGLKQVDGVDSTTRFVFSNCIMRQKDSDVGVRYGNTLFTGCQFVFQAGATQGLSFRGYTATNLNVMIDNCVFELETDRLAAVSPFGTITAASVSGSTLSLTMSTAHGISAPGNFGFSVVYLTGLTPAAYNGAYYVSGVPDTTHLELAAQKTYGALTVGSATAKLVPYMEAIRTDTGESVLNTITVQNSRFGFGFLYGVNQNQGGSLVIRNNTFDSFVMGAFGIENGDSSKVLLASNTYSANARIHFNITAHDTTVPCTLELTMDERVPVTASYIRRIINLDSLIFRGHRTIFDIDPPVNTQVKFPGDIFEKSAFDWGTPNQYLNIDNSYNNNESWRAINPPTADASTGGRPTLTSLDVGTQYFDTTLGVPIWWNGSAWEILVTTSDTQTLTNKTLTSPSITTPTGIVKGDVGLGNVDNTSDVNKPVSTAQATAIALKLAIASNLSDLNNVSTARTNLGLGTLATQSGTFSGTSSGTNTGDQTTVSGNAGTATTLATARTIGTLTGDVTSSGSSFNGSAANTNATVVVKINGVALSGLATGILKNTTTTGVPSIATAGTDFTSPTGTETLTNKRVTKRAPAITQSATPTINTDITDVAHITGLAQAITSMTTNLTGTPVEGDTLRIDITDNGTARAITWGAKFEASTTQALPTTTVISTRMDIGFFWNTVTSKWRCMSIN